MANISIFLLCLLVYFCEALISNNDLDRMQELGQNAKLGPNLLGRSRFTTQHSTPSKKVKKQKSLNFLLKRRPAVTKCASAGRLPASGRRLAWIVLAAPDSLLPRRAHPRARVHHWRPRFNQRMGAKGDVANRHARALSADARRQCHPSNYFVSKVSMRN